jgi:hypothetical protein
MERLRLEELVEGEEEKEDLVVEHELRGVEPEMIDWFWVYLFEAEGGREERNRRYRLWHPRDHVSFEWEEGGVVHRVVERIGETPPVEMRMRPENPEETPLPRSTPYRHAVASSILDRNARPIGWVMHEYDGTPLGTRMRSTFRLPSSLLRVVRDSLHRHCLEEMGEFTRFLPELYREEKE